MSAAAEAGAGSPTVSGPVTGGNGVPIVFSGQPADRLVGRETFDLASVGYMEEEFFLEGTANAYSPAAGSTLTSDGKWTLEPSSQAPYTTRVVVSRPIDDRDFNGTVVVEWLNVSGGANQPNPGFTCASPINTGPQTFVLRSAMAGLNRWVARGTPPPEAPRLETISIAPVQYVLDANGNVRGGIRTPAVDAPVATLSGLGQTGTTFCVLFGTTMPLTQEQLTALYRNHGGFVRAWSRATLNAFRAGFLRPEDALNLLVVGARSDIP
jgi:hypothetical protein